MKKILVIHGPNLNLLGVREPEIYGSETLASLDQALIEEGSRLGLQVETFQSNHEGALIDRLHAARGFADGILLNPGGLTHSSVSLRDAIAALDCPVVEVHMSNTFAREEFRRVDLVAPVCRGTIAGLGRWSYLAGLYALGQILPTA
jgi:3-dehydroquinate dehydratase-2